MKKYHVYGLGNALVDMEIEVTEDFLTKMSIEKGLMTLVEKERQDELLNAVGGERHKRTCGGSAANTVIAVAQFGGKSFYSCKVASDETGDFYYKNLTEEGVDNNLGGGREEGVTGKCMVFITPDADRTMNTFLGITSTFSDQQIDEQALKDSEYLYIEGYLVTGPNSLSAAVKARELAEQNGVKTAITLSDPGVVSYFKNGFNEMIGGGVDLLFCNEEEAFQFTDTDSIEAAAAKLKEKAKAFAITRGPKGAYLFDGEKEIDIVAPTVDPVDTNGAGDLFAGAFLYALTHGHNFADAGRLACHASSTLVTKFGARLESSKTKEIYQATLG